MTDTTGRAFIVLDGYTRAESGGAIACRHCGSAWDRHSAIDETHDNACPVPLAREVQRLREDIDRLYVERDSAMLREATARAEGVAEGRAAERAAVARHEHARHEHESGWTEDECRAFGSAPDAVEAELQECEGPECGGPLGCPLCNPSYEAELAATREEPTEAL